MQSKKKPHQNVKHIFALNFTWQVNVRDVRKHGNISQNHNQNMKIEDILNN